MRPDLRKKGRVITLMPCRIAKGENVGTTRELLRITGVCERDIDLLLLEEFLASVAFRHWFVATAAINELSLGDFLGANRSVTHSTGESDLEVRFSDSDGGTLVLLVENKIGASLQPQQAERYHARGDDYFAKGHCSRYRTVIVAPLAYFVSPAQLKGFQHRLSYEALIEWFEQAHSIGERRHYKVAILRSAIEKATLGYDPVADAGVTGFFQTYWHKATELHPELGMRKPMGRPSGSGRVYFKTPELVAIHADIAHKTSKGWVDLQLRGRGSRLAMVEAALGRLLEPGMTIESAMGSAAVRLQVPKLDRQDPATGQMSGIEAGVRAAKRLSDWALRHETSIAGL
jgi:hypothetical protein